MKPAVARPTLAGPRQPFAADVLEITLGNASSTLPLATGALRAPWHADCICLPVDGFLTEDGVAFNIDGYLGASAPALKVSADRTELIARNLSNSDTPNYKARDIDFRAALAAATGGATGGAASLVPAAASTAAMQAPGGSLALTATNPGHLGMPATAAADPLDRGDLKYRIPLAPALDGNTVDPQLEQAAFAETTVRYQASLTFLGAKFHNLMTAITGS